MNSELGDKICQLIKRILQSVAFKNAGIYTIGNFANASIPFFLLPIMTRYLTPEDYGIIATFGVLLGIYSPLIHLNTPWVIIVKYFKMSQTEFPQYVSNCLLTIISACLVATTISVIFSVQIEQLSSFSSEWLWAVIIVAFCASIIIVWLFVLQATTNPYLYAATQISQTILNAGLSVWFIVWLQMSWQGRIGAWVISAIVVALASIILLHKNDWLCFKYNFSYIKAGVKFGVPLIPQSISWFILSLADRLIIAKIIGLSETGIYSVGLQFSLGIFIIVSSLNNAYSPWLFKKLNTAATQAKAKIVLLSYGYMAALLILAVCTSYFMPIIVKIFVDEKFYGAIQIIFWGFLAQAFVGMYLIMWNFINYAERTRVVFFIEIFLSLFHLGCCYLFVKENGMTGAAQAFALTCFLKFLLIWLASNKAYPMPWLSFYKELSAKPTIYN